MGKEKDPTLKHQFILDMTDFLIGYGMNPEEAYKIAEDFYKKHKKKLRDTLALF